VLLAMVRKKACPIGQNPLRLCRAGGATEEMGQERTFSPFETRNLTQQSRGSQPAPSPALPDREEAQRCHRDDDKDENRDKAQPNQVHFAQLGPPAASVRFETLVVLCICVLIPASSPDLCAGGTEPRSQTALEASDALDASAVGSLLRPQCASGASFLGRAPRKADLKKRWKLSQRQSRGGAGSDCEPGLKGRLRRSAMN
jgi:hypothetical protein